MENKQGSMKRLRFVTRVQMSNKRELEGDNRGKEVDEDRNKELPGHSARTDRLEGLLSHTVPEKTLL